MSEEMKGRSIEEVSNVQVVISFEDEKGFIVPLTGFQGALLLELLEMKINSETGELTHATDEELVKKFQVE